MESHRLHSLRKQRRGSCLRRLQTAQCTVHKSYEAEILRVITRLDVENVSQSETIKHITLFLAEISNTIFINYACGPRGTATEFATRFQSDCSICNIDYQ